MGPGKSHPGEGELRAYQDQALSIQRQRQIETHLAGCEECQARLAALAASAQQAKAKLSLLDPRSDLTQEKSRSAAYIRLTNHLELEKEKSNMKTSIFGRVPRLAWALLIIIGVLAVALTFEPVRVLANSFLALFRVEQIRVIQIDDTDLSTRLQNSTQLEYIMSNNVQVDVQGETQSVASTEEAAEMAGFALRLPQNSQPQCISVDPAARMSFTVNLELIRGVLKDIQREDIQLPDNLDGAVVQVDVPSSVTIHYGDCAVETPADQTDPDETPVIHRDKKCVSLAQVTSPTVSAPPDLDLNQLGQAYLEVIGMSPEEAASFAQNINWTTTFVVPLPRNYGNYEEVDVQGSKGILVFEHGSDEGFYSLVWAQDGVVFALSGWGDRSSALSIANSIQ